MGMEQGAAQALLRTGTAALERGDGPDATRCFAALADGGFATPPVLIALAKSARLGGDHDAEMAALDRALVAAPSHVEALLLRGDVAARVGDPVAASNYFQAALKISRGQPAPMLAASLRKAEEFVQARGREFVSVLDRALSDHGEAGLRFQHAVEMLTGRREIYPQGPSVFYLPYLAQRQFFEREEFAWIEELEAATPAIRAELEAAIAQGVEFRPYVEAEKNRAPRDVVGLKDDPSWTALYLWKDGEQVEENARKFPATMAALANVPLSRIGQRTPSVLFSRLLPGAHIPPHRGMLNSRLICHLPLIVPSGCWLRVGNETREWEQGRTLIFDDSIEHEARNPSGETRIILLFDIWRPELGEAERDGISAIFNAIDRYTTLPPA